MRKRRALRWQDPPLLFLDIRKPGTTQGEVVPGYKSGDMRLSCYIILCLGVGGAGASQGYAFAASVGSVWRKLSLL